MSDGGGMSNQFSSPSLSNVSFSGNSANYGGGMYNQSSSPSLTNVSFSGNSAAIYGGGMYNYIVSSPITFNSVFINNTATSGEAIFNYSGSGTFINCTFIGTGTYPVFFAYGWTLWKNCIVWGTIDGSNYTVSNSLVKNSNNTSNGNIDATGLADTDIFTDPTNGDYTLKNTSPAINTGNNQAYIDAGGDLINDVDLANNPRLSNGIIDLGAYENQCPSGNILYVNANATGANNGSSWTNAFNELQDALSLTCANTTEIWVAAGTYFPDQGGGNTLGDRNTSFILKNNMAIYGGFIGNESSVTQRNTAVNPTILSGDIGTLGVNSDNSYHVVISVNCTHTTILDGFTIKDGNANGSGSVSINGNTIIKNYGGGVYNSSSSPVLTNLIISGNSSGWNGGGIYNDASSPILTNLTISGNETVWGGGIYNNDSPTPVLTNVTISGNSGGGILNVNSSPRIRNTIVYGNSNGVVDFDVNSSSDIAFSLVQGRVDINNGNISGNINPKFINPLSPGLSNGGNYNLDVLSRAINAGSNTSYTDVGGNLQTDMDLAGNPRLYNGTPSTDIIDMGAYEVQGELGATDYFITTWKTDNPGTSNSTSITIPTKGSGYSYDVSWKNDGVWENGFTGNATHDYGTAGNYIVAIRGDFPRIYFIDEYFVTDNKKIVSIDQWGTNVWSTMDSAFFGCSNLVNNATDAPDLTMVSSLYRMFAHASSFNANIGNWDVSNVSNMTYTFAFASAFNGDISNWDVSNVSNMVYTFSNASAFNQDISNWDVSICMGCLLEHRYLTKIFPVGMWTT